MRKLLIVLCAFAVWYAPEAKAQPEVQTVWLDLDARQFEDAHRKIEKYMQSDKGKAAYKGWIARGDVHKHFSLLKYDLKNYNFGDAESQYNKEQKKALQDKIEEPLAMALEYYKKGCELDVKGKAYKKFVTDNMNQMVIMAVNQASTNQNSALAISSGKSNLEGEEELKFQAHMKKSYHFFNLVLDLLDFMPESQREATLKGILGPRNRNDPNDKGITIQYLKESKAKCSYYIGDLDIAQTELDALVSADYYNLDIYSTLGKVYKDKGNIEEAKAYWEKVTSLHPNKADLAIEEAVFYQEIGETETLMMKLDRVIELNPTNATLYNVQGKILADFVINSNNEVSKDEDERDAEKILAADVKVAYYDKAMSRLTKAAELDGSEVSSYNLMGVLYYSEGLDLYNQRIRLGTSKADMAKKAELKTQYTQFFDDAIVQYEKAIASEAENLNALSKLQEIYARKNDLAKAMEYKKKYEAAKAKKG